MRVTSVIILLGSGIPNQATLFYRGSTEDSNILRNPIDLYEAWNKPEEIEKWRVRLPKEEVVQE